MKGRVQGGGQMKGKGKGKGRKTALRKEGKVGKVWGWCLFFTLS